VITAGIYDRRNGVRPSFCVAAILSRSCPLWVRSRHWGSFAPCPLYPRKRTRVFHIRARCSGYFWGLTNLHLSRPVFAPETPEQRVTKRGEYNERSLILLRFFGERSLHTGEVVGSIPTAPTIFQALIGSVRQYRAERYVHAHAQTGSNPGDLFTVRIWPQAR